MISETKTRAKQIDDKMIGPEPIYSPLKSDQSYLIKGLNYYSYTHDAAKSREWALLWVNKTHPELVKSLSKVRDSDFENRGFVCRMIERGFCLSDKQEIAHHQFFINLANQVNPVKKVVKAPVDEPAPKKIINKINPCLANLDNAIQDVLENQAYSVKTSDKKEELLELISYCDANLLDMQENPNDYILQSLRKMRTVYNEYKDYANRALKALSNQQTRLKAPVKTTSINPAKMTKMVQFLKSYPELNLKSISVTGIIGGKRLYVYDVVARKIRSFTSNATAGFMFTGTTLKNFDPEKSVAKTVRNPQTFFSQFNDGILISDLHKAFKNLTTTEATTTGRFNENLILLKVS